MEISGRFELVASRQRVWDALQDPEILKASIPGCDEFEKLSDTEFKAKVTAKVGPMKATFVGKVTLSDLDAPVSYTLTGEGQGGVAGFAKGSAKVTLEETQNSTLLRYTVHAMVGGKLAQIGSRVVEGTVRKMANEFFGRFAEQVCGVPAEAPAAATGPSAAVSPAASRPLPGALWIGGLIAAAVILLVTFL